MHLTDADLQQLNAERVSKLTPIQTDDLLLRMPEDLKEARERLNAHSGNSWRPPGSDPPRGPVGDRCCPGEPADKQTLPEARGPDRESEQAVTVFEQEVPGWLMSDGHAV